MYDGYTPQHPTGGAGLATWKRNPAGATTPSAQQLAEGATGGAGIDAPPRAGTGGSTAPVRPPTPGVRAGALLDMRRPKAAPDDSGKVTLRQPPPGGQPPPGPTDPYHPPGYTPGVAAPSAAPPVPATPPPTPAPAPYVPTASDYQPIQPGFIANGAPTLRSPLNLDGTALTGAQLAALAGTGRPGDPFQGGFTPIGGWSPDNIGRTPDQQASAVAAYKAQYGDPSVTLQSVLSQTSADEAAREQARQAAQAWQDSVGRFL